MKKIIPIFLLVLFANSCGKICGCFLPPSPKPLNFEVIDKNGQTVLKTLKDSVTVTYMDNNYSNLNKTISLTVRKLYTNFTDTTTVSSNYNGLYVSDNALMCILSSEGQPVNGFNLRINGVNLGVINLNYQQFMASYPTFSTGAFSFNGMQVLYSNGLNILKLQ